VRDKGTHTKASGLIIRGRIERTARAERKACTGIGARSYGKAISEYFNIMTSDFLLFSLKVKV